MKSVFEYYAIMILGMFFTVVLVQLVAVMVQVHEAHAYQDFVIAMIRHHHGYDRDTSATISEYGICSSCQYQVSFQDERYWVDVDFEVAIPIIGFTQTVGITGVSTLIESAD